jgi:2-oxoglutarate ferredoxin oxidoreductase subunit delta
MSDDAQIEVNESWCKGCKICAEVCPRDVFEMRDFVAKVKDNTLCTGCMLCELLCPDFAIVVHPPKKKKLVVE